MAPWYSASARRLLGNQPDAEDAFQATFIVLLRKASAIRPPGMVGNWLHGVAYRAAMKVKTALARRGARERSMSRLPEPATVERGLWDDLLPVLDQELDRLPAKYRIPIVLCDLEGKTRKDAARQLGWPEGTVAGRLAQARALLARRLTRHGLPVSGGVLTAVLSQHAADAAVPPMLLSAIMNPAVRTGAEVAASIANIVNAIMRSMLLARLKLVGAILLVLGIAVAGFGAWATRTPAAPEPSALVPADQAIAGAAPQVDKVPPQNEQPEPAPQPAVDAAGDALPQGAVARLGSLRWRHGEPIDAGALSPDGKLLATAGNASLHLFDMSTGRTVHTLRGHTRRVTHVTFSPDNRTLLSSSIDGSLREWDATTGEPQRVLIQNMRYVNQAAYSPDGTLIAVAVDAGPQVQYLAFLDAKTGKELDRMAIDTVSVVFSPNGRFLATTAGYTQRAFLIDVAARRTVATLTERAMLVHGVAFSPDSRTVAADPGYQDDGKPRAVALWDVPTARVRQLLRVANVGRPSYPQFGPDGKTLQIGLVVYDLATQAESRLPDALGTVFASTPDRNVVAGHSGNGAIRIWDRAEAKLRATPPGHAGAVTILVPGADGKELIAFGNHHRRAVWQIATGRLLEETPTALLPYTVSADWSTVVAVPPSASRKMLLYNVADGKLITELTSSRGLPRAVALAPDARLVAAARFQVFPPAKEPEWYVEVIDTKTDKVQTGIKLGQTRRTALAFSPDAKILAIGADDGRLQFFDPTTAQPIGVKEIPAPAKARVEQIAYAPDGSTLAVAYSSGDVVQWDAATAKELRRLAQRAGPITYSADGKTLAALDPKRMTIHLHDATTGAERGRLTGHGAAIRALAFSPDGRRLYSGSDDTTALVWDITRAN
jgi:RNA polymerase sigma factor (sigma-70 family)